MSYKVPTEPRKNLKFFKGEAKLSWNAASGLIDADEKDHLTTDKGLKIHLKDVRTSNQGISFSVSTDIDYGSARISIGQDDDGLAAFVDFSSDGPMILSYYRCTGEFQY